jgi:biopolymer transport protein ExbD
VRFIKEADDVASEDLLNLTSMIDVVFTLLAFFVITVRFFGAERDAVVGSERPVQQVAGVAKGDLPERVTIQLLEQGNGGMRIRIGSNEYSEAAAITRQLQEIGLPDVPVVFSASPGLTVEQVTGAVDAALKSPMKNVTLRRLGAGE